MWPSALYLDPGLVKNIDSKMAVGRWQRWSISPIHSEISFGSRMNRILVKVMGDPNRLVEFFSGSFGERYHPVLIET